MLDFRELAIHANLPFLTTPLTPTSVPKLARWGCAMVCLVWLLAGNLGHDPWKADDAIHLGLAYGIFSNGALIPQLAGEPWLASPPLFHWLAASSGALLDPILPWHDAARLATAIFGGIFLTALALTAQRLIGASASLAAPFLAIGTLGFIVPLHDANPASAQAAFWAVSLLGLTLWPARPLTAGCLFGLGTGAGFLAAGLQGAALPLLTALLLQGHPHWRRRAGVMAWLSGLIIAAAIALPWMVLLHRQAPLLFEQWWMLERAQPLLAARIGRDHLELLAWATWPVLPLAGWTLWLERKRLGQPQNLLPLVATLAGLCFLAINEAREAAVLPVLVPLTLLAANGAGRLRRGAANAFDWFGMMTLSLIAALIWLGGIALLTGEPQRVAKNFTIPAPDFVPHVALIPITLAIAVTVAWIAVMLRTPRSPWRAAARWSVGVTTVWVLLSTLWLPWIDHVKTYRTVSGQIQAALTTDASRRSRLPDCIAGDGLGPAHRASLDYFDGLRTVSAATKSKCRYRLVQTDPKAGKALPGWDLLLETARPADRSERLRLYRAR